MCSCALCWIESFGTEPRVVRVMALRLFIGSSTEALDVAYAIQANLEREFEVTVWNQGVFTLSKSVLGSLLQALHKSDFGVFVLTPDDITIIRDRAKNTARDNVIFELGLFIGHLGKERAYFVVPSGVESLELPSDLAGITYARYRADREDENFEAALGPACQAIRKASQAVQALVLSSPRPQPKDILDKADALSILETWMGSRTPDANVGVIRFSEVDRELRLPPGTSSRLLEEAARHYGYTVRRRGASTICFDSGYYDDDR